METYAFAPEKREAIIIDMLQSASRTMCMAMLVTDHDLITADIRVGERRFAFAGTIVEVPSQENSTPSDAAKAR